MTVTTHTSTPTHTATATSTRAFTLVELLVSMALILTVLPVVMEVCSHSAALAGEARRRTEAAVLAEGELARLVATGEWRRGVPTLRAQARAERGPSEGATLPRRVAFGEASGDFGPDRPGFRWTLELGEAPRADLRLVSVTVTWTARGRERSLAVVSLEPREQSP